MDMNIFFNSNIDPHHTHFTCERVLLSTFFKLYFLVELILENSQLGLKDLKFHISLVKKWCYTRRPVRLQRLINWRQYWNNMLCQLKKNVALWRCKSLLRVVPSNVTLSREFEIQNSKQRSYRRFGKGLISSLSPYRCSLLRYILSRFFCFIL